VLSKHHWRRRLGSCPGESESFRCAAHHRRKGRHGHRTSGPLRRQHRRDPSPRLQWPLFARCMQSRYNLVKGKANPRLQGPLAIRVADFASVFAAGVSTGASWDKDLMYERGLAMGREFKAKGAHVVLGPVAGPLGRSAYAGRNWEGFSSDPYLSGVAMEKTITGHQDAGVQACAKHWVGNEQEIQRNPTYVNGTNEMSSNAVSSNIDDRTMHELYMWPFANAVKARAASFMCSYQRINGSYGTKLL